jgi:tetratricopeptide (TPR) repeat protein
MPGKRGVATTERAADPGKRRRWRNAGATDTATAIDDALGHLNAALKLAPQDLSLHQGRLHLLEISYRFDAMAKALEESCSIYKGPDVPDAWLAYTYELGEGKQYKAALALLQILDKHYPNNHDIVGNIGAMYSFL